MKTKRLLTGVLALSMVAGLSMIGCADLVNNTDTDILIGESIYDQENTQESQTRSFHRAFSGSITGGEWTKVAWDANLWSEKDYEINLDSDTAQNADGVSFRLEAGDTTKTFTLYPGDEKRLTIKNGAAFSLYAQYNGATTQTGSIRGRISLGNVSIIG